MLQSMSETMPKHIFVFSEGDKQDDRLVKHVFEPHSTLHKYKSVNFIKHIYNAKNTSVKYNQFYMI